MTPVQRIVPLSLAFAALPFLAACSGGGDSSEVQPGTGGDFVVLATEPQDNGQLFLNEPISIDFSNPVDLGSADLTTLSFTVLDQNGNPTAEQPAGTFRLARSPGDSVVGRRLEFVPKFPTNDTFDNGGFRPGRTYLLQLVGGSRINQTVLRDINGKPLAVPRTLTFSTADGSRPEQLFRDLVGGGPAFVDAELVPSQQPFLRGGSTVRASTLNHMGQRDLEVRLTFNQPLNPHSSNVPVNLNTDPLVRGSVNRGRIFLEYDDPDLDSKWVPADVDLAVNDLDRSVVVLRPVGVLPNNAEVRVVVSNTLEDISGESNVSNSAFEPVVHTFRTDPRYEPQFDAVVEGFSLAENEIDFEAPIVEPLAHHVSGAVEAGFDFEGSPTVLDYEPTSKEVVLSTTITSIQPSNGQPFTVSGGVFNFDDVTINPGVSVRGIGENPMVWLVSGDFVVSGTLSVRGGNGDRVGTVGSAGFPAAGGIGAAGGGDGGRGSPNTNSRSPQGERGFGPGQVPEGGGRGGRLACTTTCSRGSGGGGGSFATQGDPWYPIKASGPDFQQQVGVGGRGCTVSEGRALPGGRAGVVAFTDTRSENNFWGAGVNIQRQIRISGELSKPIGGQGGGGGGDYSNANCNPDDPNFISDARGGGGGGGGGVLIVKCLGRIVINEDGLISADGGHGGGGAQAGSSDLGGGGGGGSGGMVVLMAAKGIDIHAHGETYANDDYKFAVSADGGVCRTGTFGSPRIQSKYPPDSAYDDVPLGGFGGMGVVQLMGPVGDNSDNTNTALDDGITIFKAGIPASASEKERYLAWRGLPNENGVLVDDNNNPINIGDDEGDIRPAPILLPAPIGTRSRLRSNWIDTGATVRRPVIAPDGQPRGVIDPNGNIAGPRYEFAATRNDPGEITHGFIEYMPRTAGVGVDVDYPEVLASRPGIESIDPSATFLGEPAYRIVLTSPVVALGQVDANRYVQHQLAVFDDNGTLQGEYRILEHSDRVFVVAPDEPAPSSPDSIQILRKFFDVSVDGDPGLGPTYIGSSGAAVPRANARIGFAFHQDPSQAKVSGTDPLRMPDQVGEFLYDLTDPATQDAVRQFGAAFVKWDILFDMSFKSDPGDVPPDLAPDSPRPALHFLRLPYRF